MSLPLHLPLPPKPSSYEEPRSDLIPFYALLSRQGVAYGACFLAVINAKTKKIKSLMAIPFSSRRVFFQRQELMNRSDARAHATGVKFMRIFDYIGDNGNRLQTIECPQAILAYYEKDINDFSPNESVYAFWANDFIPYTSITYMERVAGVQLDITPDMVDEIRERYRQKFGKLYQLQKMPGEMLDFTCRLSYHEDVYEYRRTVLSSYHILLRDCTHQDLLQWQKHLVRALNCPMQMHQLPISYAYYDVRERLSHSASPPCFWSLFMSYARCLYDAFIYFTCKTRKSGNAGRALLDTLDQSPLQLICDDMRAIENRKDVEKWLDTAIHVYCIALARNAFWPNTGASALNDHIRQFYGPVDGCRPSTFNDEAVVLFCRYMFKYRYIPFVDNGELKRISFHGAKASIQHITKEGS